MRKLAMASSAGGSARTEICNHAEGTTFYATPACAVQLNDRGAGQLVIIASSI
jgi:hypothetical protein